MTEHAQESEIVSTAELSKKNVAVFLGDPGGEEKIQEYARVNSLTINYTFNRKDNSSEITPTIMKSGVGEIRAIISGKRGFGKSLINSSVTRLKGLSTYVKQKRAYSDTPPFLFMLEYLTQYKQCQGLLVNDVRDIYPKDLSVVRYVIDRLRESNKDIFAVIPYDYESLPQYGTDLGPKITDRWNKLLSTCDLHYEECPPIVSICVFENECFCKCRFCYQVRNPQAFKEEYMDFDLLKKIVRDTPVDKHLKIVLGPGGEPLTYPLIHEMIRYVTDTRPLATTEYSSNGILMDEENARKIIQSGLSRLEISLNVPDRENYHWFTGVDAYDKVVANMKGFMKLREKLNSPTPVVITKVMGMKRWEDKIDDFVRFWSSVVDEARVSPVSYYQDEELENIESLKSPANPLVPTSFYLTSNMLIMPNGRYQLCCAPDFVGEKYGPVDLGNAGDHNVMDVWLGEKYQKLRKINAQGLPIFANCLSCNINRPTFESDLIVKSKQRQLLGLDK